MRLNKEKKSPSCSIIHVCCGLYSSFSPTVISLMVKELSQSGDLLAQYIECLAVRLLQISNVRSHGVEHHCHNSSTRQHKPWCTSDLWGPILLAAVLFGCVLNVACAVMQATLQYKRIRSGEAFTVNNKLWLWRNVL